MSVLREVDEKLWVSDHPDLRFLGIKVGTRMTVVELPDGLWVHSPVPLTPQIREAVEALGPVKYVVAPNLYHHLYAGPWAEAFPEAKLFGVRGLAKKRPDLDLDGEVDDDTDPQWPGISLVSIRGSMLGETIFHHAPTGTVISADLFENFHHSDSWLTRAYLKTGGIYGKAGVHRVLRFATRDKPKARAGIDRVLAWEFNRVIVSHGSIVETDAKPTLRDAYGWL